MPQPRDRFVSQPQPPLPSSAGAKLARQVIRETARPPVRDFRPFVATIAVIAILAIIGIGWEWITR